MKGSAQEAGSAGVKEATHSAPRLLLSPYRTADLLLVSSLSAFLSSQIVLMPTISCLVRLALIGLCNFFPPF